ncbi:MAG: UTP--glucose-1-phosphate uridylyltransferase [Planctomycetota bacterium]
MTDARRERLVQRYEQAGQAHVLRFLDRLGSGARDAFMSQLEALDLERVMRLARQAFSGGSQASSEALEPPELIDWGESDAHRERDARARDAGQEALREGRVAAFLVAGGQGTRLGYDGPKGRFPVGPLTDRSLFAYHAHRVLATSRRYGAAAPLLVMTSEVNHESTVAAFEEAGWFGLEPEQVRFLTQGMLPALDRQGRLLLADEGSLSMSPDGHGGSLVALARSGVLDDLSAQGIEEIFYFQVDNPLAPVLDPVFIGHHLLARAEMSTKVVAKTDPAEKVGVVARRGERTNVIEYSDLDPELAAARDEGGRLRFRAANIAIHVLHVPFVRRLTSGGLELPVHRAEKRVPCLDDQGRRLQPDEPNAIKLEQFVFDALPLAVRTVTQEVTREDEFAPVKNAAGADSPETARAALSSQARRWMAAAGLALPKGDVEVGPLFALDRDEFLATLARNDFGPVFDRS